MVLQQYVLDPRNLGEILARAVPLWRSEAARIHHHGQIAWVSKGDDGTKWMSLSEATDVGFFRGQESLDPGEIIFYHRDEAGTIGCRRSCVQMTMYDGALIIGVPMPKTPKLNTAELCELFERYALVRQVR